jgi:hypothetical protein
MADNGLEPLGLPSAEGLARAYACDLEHLIRSGGELALLAHRELVRRQTYGAFLRERYASAPAPILPPSAPSTLE